MEMLLDPQLWISLLTLTALEIVLGIDNVIFIAILAGKLPADQQQTGRSVGLILAIVTRVLLLFSLTFLMGLTKPWMTVLGQEISGRDLILLVGGMFLIGKSTLELHEKLEGAEHAGSEQSGRTNFMRVIFQIALLDIVFSLDSVITAIGLASQLGVMVAAVMIAALFMLWFAGAVSRFVDKHPTVKILALAFLVLIGFTLAAEGTGLHIPKGYVYFAMSFAVIVEMLNVRWRTRPQQPVILKGPRLND
ncbi:MAG: TerC family protein [Chloroflexi bacterium]|nr:MAG: TerC family protein [Chloroflexota bacterium]RLT46660.1 MAG: TerC family protein [Chloroflexota bacterium]RLT53475.1 MAG: TerC family protein [Chloroflexota bacterium]